MSARLATVVVNCRTPALTARCAAALARSLRPVERLFLVDDASGDDSVERLRRDVPAAMLVPLPARSGFAAAANAGIRRALAEGADLVFLLNSDAEVEPDCLHLLEREILAGAGLAGPAIVSFDEPPIVESLGIDYSPWTGRMRLAGAGGRPEQGPAREVAALSGCALLVRREVFERAGLLDETYFFSFEDLDLCLRARRAGFTCRCAPAARVRHRGSASIGARSPRRLYFSTRNHLRLARDAFPLPAPLSALRSAHVLALAAAHAALRSGAPLAPALRAVARGARDYGRGRTGSDRQDGPSALSSAV